MKCVLKYPGSKLRIAEWVISHFPSHHSYLEPYMGSLAVLINKPPSRIETCNDLNGDVVNLFKVIREDPDTLMQAVALTPFAREEYDAAFTGSRNPIEKARQFLVRSWQGHGYRENGYKVGWKHDVQGREAAYALRNWNRVPGWISQTAERLKSVQIENRPALDLIRRFNYPNVLIYADPPYVLSTRSGPAYTHEMTDDDHVELLETLLQHKGTVVLSGYDNDIYSWYLRDWGKDTVQTHAEKGVARTECLWTNFEHQLKLI